MSTSTIRRIVAAVAGVALLGSVAACGDNAAIDDPDTVPSSKTEISGNFAGAGASSQQAAVEAWISGFQRVNPQAKISYNPSGSGAGVTTFLTGATAWASSDKPLDHEEVNESKSVCKEGTAFDVPVYATPIAVAFNLNGVSDTGQHLRMDASTIAKIFNGSITQWNDPAIAKQNPDVTLPHLPITIVHRSDKSGTTLNFVEYLKAAAGNDWKYDLSENWPNELGQGAKGTSGVVSTITQANGTIGYADLSQVGELGTVAVKVGDDYVPISAKSASNALVDSKIDESVQGANRVVVAINHNTKAKNAYPIVMISYDIACPVYKDENTGRFAQAWLTYITSQPGQIAAQKATGSAPLPSNITDAVEASIEAMN